MEDCGSGEFQISDLESELSTSMVHLITSNLPTFGAIPLAQHL